MRGTLVWRGTGDLAEKQHQVDARVLFSDNNTVVMMLCAPRAICSLDPFVARNLPVPMTKLPDAWAASSL